MTEAYKDQGVYCLIMILPDPADLKIGARGTCRFPPGYYCYVGSAHANLAKRLARHQSREKKLRWHIDYLLQRARIIDMEIILTSRRLECEFSRAVARQAGPVVMPGFGSSDCRCLTHLHHFRFHPGAVVARAAGRLKYCSGEQSA